MHRVQEKELGGGVLLDIGLYSLHLATLVFGMEKPVKVILKGYSCEFNLLFCDYLFSMLWRLLSITVCRYRHFKFGKPTDVFRNVHFL
jgi:hypothetical protein